MPAAGPENQFDENGASLRPCPICGKPAVFATRPFCSKRCADIDLHRWLAGYYAVPASHEPNAEPDGPGEQRVAKISEP